MVVGDIARQNPLEMPLVQNNHVIQTFPPYGANARSAYGFCQGDHATDIGALHPTHMLPVVAAQSRPHSDVPSHLSSVSAADRSSE